MLSSIRSAFGGGGSRQRSGSVSSRKSGYDTEAEHVVADEPAAGIVPAWHREGSIQQLTVKVMDDLVQEGALEPGWKTRRHTHFDFSDEAFALRTFRPSGFRWVGKALKELDDDEAGEKKAKKEAKEEIKVPTFKVLSLNLDGNRITDDDFKFAEKSQRCLTGAVFGELKVLRMNRNLLRYPVILMPRLRELHLSNNAIARFPPLAGLPKLEVLNLSHNQITTLQEDMFLDVGNLLQSLDVSFNKIDVKPSEFHKVLKMLVSFEELANLQFKDNPFCVYFGEYQMLTAQVFQAGALSRLDDLSVGKNAEIRQTMVREANTYFGTDQQEKRFGSLDREYQRRSENVQKAQQRVMDAAEDLKEEVAAVKGTHPKITDLIRELDQALAEPMNVMTSVTLVFELANQITARGGAEAKALFNIPGHRSARDEAAALFVQSVIMIAERYPETRTLLFRTLAKFCSIPLHRLGELCLMALADLSRFGQESMEAIMEVISEMVLPIVQEGTLQEDSCASVVIGLSKFNSPELADKLVKVMQKLCVAWNMEARGMQTGGDDEASEQKARNRNALAKLILVAVKNKGNCISLLETEGMMSTLISESTGVLAQALFVVEVECDMYLIMMGIIEGLFVHNRTEVVRILKEGQAHEKLRGLLLGFWRKHTEKESKGDGTMKLPIAKKAGSAVGIIVEMLGGAAAGASRPQPCVEVAEALLKKVEVKDDRKAGGSKASDGGRGKASSGNDFIDFLLDATADENADPVLLAKCLQCLTLILNATDMKDKFKFEWLSYLVSIKDRLALENTQNNKVLPYIDSKKFKALYKRCEEHYAYSDEEYGRGGGANVSAQVPDLNGATNPICHDTITSVVTFLRFFSYRAGVEGEGQEECADVSQALNKQGRESLLFKLLEVPSEEVQEAVMGCLADIDVEQFDDDEVNQLVGLLDPSVISRKESLLGQVMRFLQKILESPGTGGDNFRAQYSRVVMDRTFEVLKGNAERKTFGSEEEEAQKLGLSKHAVDLMVSASNIDLLRKHLRTEFINQNFPTVMKNEELCNNPLSEDICLELTWTGRLLGNLFKCLDTSSRDGLDSRKKQSFRILSRIADILAGQSDHADALPPALARAKHEALMWRDRQMTLTVMALDDKQNEELFNQQNYFTTFSCMEQMLFFLEAQPWMSATGGEEAANASALDNGANKQAVEMAMEAVQRENPEIHVVKKQREANCFWKDVRTALRLEHKRLEDAEQREKDNEEVEEVDLEIEAQERMESREELLSLVYMHLGWKHVQSTLEQAPIDTKAFSVPFVPHVLRVREDFRRPEDPRLISPVYNLAAVLRAIYAILVVPTLERFREHAVMQLWETAMQVRLLVLVDRCGSYVDCNVATKFMRIMGLVLAKPVHESSVRDERQLVGIYMMASFAGRCLRMMSPFLAPLGARGKLSIQQQMLCSEASRLLGVVLADVTRLDMRVSVPKEIEMKSIAQVCAQLVPKPSLLGVFLCLIYDVQVSMGSGSGTYITEGYVRESFKRRDMYEICSEVLSTVLAFCESMRYEVLELFNKYSVLGKHKIQTSTLSQLMDRVQIHKLQQKFETMLRQQADASAQGAPAQQESVLRCMYIQLLQEQFSWGRKTTAQARRMLVVTNRRLLLTAMERHASSFAKGPCGVCPPESFCPVEPEIEKEHEFYDLTRVVVGPDSQMLILGWSTRKGEGWGARGAQDAQSRLQKEVDGEIFECVVCERASEREKLLQLLQRLSAPKVEHQVEPTMDRLIQTAIQRRTASRVLCMSYAFRKAREERLSLFVLTEHEVCEFRVCFEEWKVPSGNATFSYVGVDEIDEEDPIDDQHVPKPRPQSEQADRFQRMGQLDRDDVISKGLAQNGSSRPAVGALAGVDMEEVVEGRSKARRVTESKVYDLPKGETGSQEDYMWQVAGEAAKKVIHQHLKRPLQQLDQVEFAVGDKPVLRFIFEAKMDMPAEDVEIRFMDDGAREVWRRCLSLALTKQSDTTTQWQRKWAESAPPLL